MSGEKGEDAASVDTPPKRFVDEAYMSIVQSSRRIRGKFGLGKKNQGSGIKWKNPSGAERKKMRERGQGESERER